MEERGEPQVIVPPDGAGGLELEPLVLASSSPRRAEILRAVGWPFEAVAANVDETARGGEEVVEYVERLACEKAEAVAEGRASGLVVGADTVVAVGGQVLGKPSDDEDARRMLRLLSGRWHDVLTGVALVRAETGEVLVSHELTRVRFAAMSDEEIDGYIATGEPADKAGAYGVQGRASLFIEEIEGDYWNVVGLPVRLLYKLAGESRGS
ncbi:MAG: nucleoside triphosphate pyrophosphatase [Pyrinomonadaceae bacterium]|nr:nucleoside triphosphate pyrophosphatase [Pyrinomonadaceae bacterium]